MSGIATDQVIKELVREAGEPGLHGYTTMQGYMLDAIRTLNIFSMPTWSNVLLPITSFNTINWPKSCVKPILTILKRGNKKYLLSVSTSLLDALPDDYVPTETDETCDAEDLLRVDGLIDIFGWSVWNWGLGELYGSQTLAPPYGLVIHDKKNRQSYIKGVKLQTGDQIYFFFKDDGLHNCPKFIPAEAKDTCEFYMLMKWFRVRN